MSKPISNKSAQFADRNEAIPGSQASLARAKGFLMVSASPLTRSSYHAGDDFARLRAARLAQVRT